MRGEKLYMVSFSGGRTSAYMTEKLLEKYPADNRVICFANTGKEEPETLEFVRRCDERWGGQVNWLEYHPIDKFRVVSYETASRNGEPFAALIEKRMYLPNVVFRFCTQDLKIRVIKHFMMSLGHRHWTNVVGIRYDEPMRWSRTKAIAEKERWDTWLPLVDWKVTKPMVLDFWRGMPFDLNLEHYLGNCDLCFLKGRNKIKRLLAEHPEKADWWIRQEKLVGATFRKGFSYEKFIEWIRENPALFGYDEGDVECICNLD